MTLCDTAPVHIPAGDINEFLHPGTGEAYSRSFVEEFFGAPLIADIKAMFGDTAAQALSDEYLYAGYCSNAFMHSATWGAGQFLSTTIAFSAGVLFRWKRRAAKITAAVAVAVSIASLIHAVSGTLNFLNKIGPDYSILIYDFLPIQIFANMLFQIAIPFLVGWAIASLIGLLSRLAKSGLKLNQRSAT